MGKTINGKYIYSIEDCRCEFCLYFYGNPKKCQINICCCLAEKEAALARIQIDNEEARKCAG